MQDKTIVITGASDGIGAAAAEKLKALGASVIIVGRSPDKTKQVADKLGVPYYIVDFASFDDVRSLAAKLNDQIPKIDILVNNAGGIMGKRELTIDGHEKTLQVNHLSPFLLTNLLIDKLIANKAVIINTSSAAARHFSDFDIDNIELEDGYNANKAYGNSKLANILFSTELNKRYLTKGLAAVSFHPGVVATNFSDNSTSVMRILYHTALKNFLITSEQGADTLVWLATSKAGVDWIPGEYYEKRKIAKTSKLAFDSELAGELWQRSLTMTGLKTNPND